MKRNEQLEAYEADIIANAIEFTASIYAAQGQYETTRHANLEEARASAKTLTERAVNGRKAIVYAISAKGRSVFVPPTYQPAKPQEIDMTKTNLSGTEVAKLTAVLTGGGFKRANSKDAAVKRFLSVACDKGIPHTKAATVLAMPFDLAQATLKGGAKPAKEPKVNKPAAAAPRPAGGKRAEVLAAAEAGKLPSPPDFSAKTHERFRGKLAKLVELAKAGDVKGLKAVEINPVSSSPKAMAKYRDLCVIALEARAKAA